MFTTGFALVSVMLSLPDLAVAAFGGAENPKAKGLASFWIGLSNGIKAFAGLATGPSLGSRSDVHGRKSFMVCSVLLCFISYLPLLAPTGNFIAFASFLVLNAVSGLVPILPALLTVVADDQPAENRARGFGWLMAVFDVSFLVTPFLGKVLTSNEINITVCASGALALLLAITYGESLPLEQRIRLENSPSAGQISRKWWKPENNCAILISTPLFRRLSACIFSSAICMAGIQQCFILYLETSLNLTKSDAGSYLAILALTGLCVQTFVLPVAVRSLGLARSLMIGLIFQVFQSILYAAFHTTVAVAIGCCLGGFGTIVFPCVSALKSLAAGEDKQGQIQGAVSALQSFAMGLGPLVYGTAFSVFSWPGSPFDEKAVFALSLVALIPAACAAFTLPKYVPSPDDEIPLPRRAVSLWHTRAQGA